MTNLIGLAVAALLIVGAATAAISRVITRERGPFAVFALIRERTMRWEKIKGFKHELYELNNCPICLSWYVSTLLTLLLVAAMGMPAWWIVLLIPGSVGISYAALGLSALWN